ncbi:hypothetical protein [Mycobacterium riyadhense]|uniref:Uncharacterized protein n=3 Tax=Mycobacterium riyadhense TaxID=486698 RepID=A0A1X2B000_9MYCO|nr:hypothetical protein [Mycobacterium riyadhense]MCV7147918.1 hypothetical protein [Mycobacterium riyadhense]ORW56988.1 hypothetical protein AWC22_00795 [Mycobacterium riyadhense]VTP03453.1 hypothetical protein BIN_B_05044 [Mycobacterium riyadhense]
MLTGAAYWDHRRHGFYDPMRTLNGMYTFGRLLAPPHTGRKAGTQGNLAASAWRLTTSNTNRHAAHNAVTPSSSRQYSATTNPTIYVFTTSDGIVVSSVPRNTHIWVTFTFHSGPSSFVRGRWADEFVVIR